VGEMSDFIDNIKTSAVVTFDSEVGFYHRGDGDLGIWKEQKDWMPLVSALTNEDTIVDIGAHIGLFEYLVRSLGLYCPIYCYEPDPNNLRVLRKNVRGNTKIHDAAIVGDDGPDEIQLYLAKTYPAANTIRPVRGRKEITVPTIKWSEILSINPSMIKCDAEGAEYLFDWRELPKSVRLIGFEFHFFKEGDAVHMENINATLVDQGFDIVRQPKENTFRKVSFGLYKRDRNQ
jgi:FkbM family methyltransferase